MATPTRSAANSLSKDSRVVLGNHAGARLVVSAVTSTTVTVESVAELTGTALYAPTTPGVLQIIRAAAGSTHYGKTANVTGISGAVLTVNVDLTAALAAGDIVLVAPPLSVELFLNAGHGLNQTLTNDYTMGLTETFDTHNTPMGIDVGGDIPFFQIPTSAGFARLLAFGIGAYKLVGANSHKFRPIEANDGTFTELEDATAYVQDGNGVIRRVFYELFGSSLTLDWPEGGRGTGTVTALGGAVAREIGGTGKTYPTGASNWIRTNFNCDTGAGITFRGVFVQLGGTFGDALSTATAETAVTSLTVRIDRGALQNRVLGSSYPIKPEEDTFMVTVSGTRLLQNDTFYELASGATTSADPGDDAKGETRMLIKAVLPQDTTKSLTIDIPRGVFTSHTVNRQRGRFTESFEFRSLATVDGTTGCVSTTVPPLEVSLLGGPATSLATTL